MSPDSPHTADRPPHPLAIALIERLAARPGARVLEIGAGSGRNTAALTRAGFTVIRPGEASPASCAAALSTHALLHGTPSTIAEQLTTIARALEADGLVHATFGSTHDARYGRGERREPFVFAPLDGDEIGVPHSYYDETRLRTALAEQFIIESLKETPVDSIAGTWAHENAPLHGAIHWFARLRRRPVYRTREAQPKDVRAWADMRAALWPETSPEELLDEAQRHFVSPQDDMTVFVCEDHEGNVVGMLELSLRSHAESCYGHPVPYIEGWFVAESVRRKGAGRSLVTAAESWARARGFTEIASDTQLDNDVSYDAHTALGFVEVERAIHFRKALPPEG